MYKIMTPGPTQVCENVRMARSRICTNPDIDVEFVEFYKKTCEHISSLLYTSNETLILDGEGILGLEAACATLTEPGDKVLVLDNGVYGRGFADFITMYILDGMKAGGIMLAGSFDDLSGKVIRIGHMGANANIGDMVETLRLLDKVLRRLGVDLKARLDTTFINNLELY